jgi:hypothetical protein
VAAADDAGATSFSEDRGTVGGPPYIPVGDIEIAQVRLDALAAAVVLASEIFQVINQHQERYDYPVWNEDNLAVKADDAAVTFKEALPAIHTGDLTKKVYAEYYEPSLIEVDLVSDFKAPEKSHSVNSTQVYSDTVATSSSSLGQGGFKALLKDGITDSIATLKDEVLIFKYKPDRNNEPYMLVQGKLGISRTFPVADNIQADCTISATSEGKALAS